VTERFRPWIRAAWRAMAAAGVATSLLPASTAAPLYRGLMATHLWPFVLLSATGAAAARPGEAWKVMAGMGAIAVGIEITQMWVPGRACEWRDLRDDGAGMALGWALVRAYGAAARRLAIS
jgi:hypothetical protein